MKNQPTLRKVALVAALAAVTATAWATSESLSSSTPLPAATTTAETMPAVAPSEPVPVVDVTAHEITAPSDDASVPVSASEATAAPAVAKEKIAAPTAPQPPITVEERRLTEDERIQADVMDKLANNPRLSGRIAVETRNTEVWLSGYTATAGQAWQAARDAGSVKGVRYVHNEIRPRVGRSL